MLAQKKKRLERRKTQAAEYAKVLAARHKEAAEKKKERKRKRSASARESKTSVGSKEAASK
jgi:hypothetical protein